MSIGVELSDEDLEALRKLYKVRWTANIRTWKEKDTDYCVWIVCCPDLTGIYVTITGHSLADTIYRLLAKVHISVGNVSR